MLKKVGLILVLLGFLMAGCNYPTPIPPTPYPTATSYPTVTPSPTPSPPIPTPQKFDSSSCLYTVEGLEKMIEENKEVSVRFLPQEESEFDYEWLFSKSGNEYAFLVKEGRYGCITKAVGLSLERIVDGNSDYTDLIIWSLTNYFHLSGKGREWLDLHDRSCGEGEYEDFWESFGGDVWLLSCDTQTYENQVFFAIGVEIRVTSEFAKAVNR